MSNLPGGDESKILVELLARTDALFLPFRDRDTVRSPVTYLARQQFLKSGLPWRPIGDSKDERKAGIEAVGELRAKGYVETQSGRQKLLSVRLTEQGDQFSRALLAQPGLCESLEMVRKLYSLAEEYRLRAVDLPEDWPVWVFEREFANWPAEPRGKSSEADLKTVIAIEDKFLPALVRGWVVSNCRPTCRTAAYQLAASGVNIATGETEPPAEIDVWPKDTEADRPAIWEHYIAVVKTELVRLGQPSDLSRASGEIGRCFLNAGPMFDYYQSFREQEILVTTQR